MPERTFGRHTTIVVGLPYYLPPYSSYSSLDYYNGSSYNRQPVYTPPAEGQIVVVEPQNARGPQDSREALLERRLDDQAVELDNLRRERNAGAQIPARQSLADGEELQPATILVFKDKRPSELIHNYAVVGSNLYVMGRNHRKIPLEDLDLTATARANEKAGLEFKIPQTSGAMKLKSGLGINR